MPLILSHFPNPKPTVFGKIDLGDYFTEGTSTISELIQGNSIPIFHKVLSLDRKKNWAVDINGSIVKELDSHFLVTPRNIMLNVLSKTKLQKVGNLPVGQVFKYSYAIIHIYNGENKHIEGYFMVIDPVNKGNNCILVVSYNTNKTYEISRDHEIETYDYNFILK